MGFSIKQTQALRRNLNDCFVRSRTSNGRELSYIEGWHAIAEANRIFGFDGWDRETLEARCVLARERAGTFLAVYVAKVRISVRAGDAVVVREGNGTGEARHGSAGEVHDMALKAAETDATKRALATFGKPFGLSLYLSGRREGRKPARASSQIIAQAHKSSVVQAQEGDDRVIALSSPGDASRRAGTVDAPLSPMGPNGATVAPATVPFDEIAPSQSMPTPSLPSNDAQPQTAPVRQTTASSTVDMPTDAARDSTSAPRSRRSSGADSGSGANSAPQSVDPADRHIDKSALFLSEPRRVRDKDHLRFVASEPCLICGRAPSDAHHLRFAQLRALGRKVSDEFTVPLCRIHHRAVHATGNEAAWWEDLNIDALSIARGMWQERNVVTKVEKSRDETDDMQRMRSPDESAL